MYLNRFRIQRLYFLVNATGRNSNRNNVVIPRSWKSLQSLQIMILMLKNFLSLFRHKKTKQFQYV